MKLLRDVLFYVVIVIIIAGSVYFAYVNHIDFERAIVRQAQSYLSATARAQSQSIEKYIGDVLRELQRLAQSPVLKANIAPAQEKAGVEAEYYYLLQGSYLGIERLVDAIYLVDARGTVVNVTPFDEEIVGQDFSRMADVRAVLNEHQPYTSGVFENIDGQKVIANIYPVFVSDKFAGMVRAMILVNRINGLVSHINEEGSRRVIIVDSRGSVVGYPDSRYIGKGLPEVLRNGFFRYSPEQIEAVADKMTSGSEGIALVGGTLIAYCPIYVGNTSWSIAVAMDYNAAAYPIKKNLRDNLLFMGFIFLVFFAATVIFYRMHKKRDELLISTATLDIINKQLHLEISQRKQIQEELQEYLHGKKGPPPAFSKGDGSLSR